MRGLNYREEFELFQISMNLDNIQIPEAKWVEQNMGEKSVLWRCRLLKRLNNVTVFSQVLYHLKDIEVILGLIRRDPDIFLADTLYHFDYNSIIHPHLIQRLTKNPPTDYFLDTLAVQLDYLGKFRDLRIMVEAGYFLSPNVVFTKETRDIQISVLARRHRCRATSLRILSLIRPKSMLWARDTLTMIAKMVFETRCNEQCWREE